MSMMKWNYEGHPEAGKDCRKLVTLRQDGMTWIGIRAWNHHGNHWQNGNEPERATVHAWMDLPDIARSFWDRGVLVDIDSHWPATEQQQAHKAGPPEELGTLACPFCGSADISDGEVLIECPRGRVTTQSMCRNCGALGPEAGLLPNEIDYGSVKARTEWNRRSLATGTEAATACEPNGADGVGVAQEAPPQEQPS